MPSENSKHSYFNYILTTSTINYISYINDTLKPLVNVINLQRPSSGAKNLKFHHDNARPHVHETVVEFLKEEKFTIMEHPPYSPDLAPCDFWLFDYIKQRLGDHLTVESLENEITKIVMDIPKHEWKKHLTSGLSE